MKTENIIELLEFILYNQKLENEDIWKIVDLFITYLENKCYGYEKQVHDQKLKTVMEPLFEKYVEDWIASYDDFDEKIEQILYCKNALKVKQNENK